MTSLIFMRVIGSPLRIATRTARRPRPADSYDLQSEFGRSDFDQRHQFYFESYVALPLGIAVSPNLFIASGAPFNITTGADDNGDTLFSDRPAFAVAGDANAIRTPFGIFNPRPQAGDKIIPRNFGRGAGEISLNLNVSKTFGFGPEKATPTIVKQGDFAAASSIAVTA
jgi:hypothetical protein